MTRKPIILLPPRFPCNSFAMGSGSPIRVIDLLAVVFTARISYCFGEGEQLF